MTISVFDAKVLYAELSIRPSSTNELLGDAVLVPDVEHRVENLCRDEFLEKDAVSLAMLDAEYLDNGRMRGDREREAIRVRKHKIRKTGTYVLDGKNARVLPWTWPACFGCFLQSLVGTIAVVGAH